MMKTFDYKKAWMEKALPEYLKLPNEIRSLLARVAEVAPNLQQQFEDLCVPIPEWLGKEFGQFPIEVLAWSAHVIYALGHWKWTPPRQGELFETRITQQILAEVEGVTEHGTCWKWSNMVDVYLSTGLRSLMVPEASRKGSDDDRIFQGFVKKGLGRDPYGITFHIGDGAIRVQFSTRDRWSWEEIGITSYQLAEYAMDEWRSIDEEMRKSRFPSLTLSSMVHLKYGPRYEYAGSLYKRTCRRLKAKAKEMSEEVVPLPFDVSAYMVDYVGEEGK